MAETQHIVAAEQGTAQLPECGEKIGGHCVLRALLGEGAFGRVFAAEDDETGQQVALKVVGLRRYPREYAEHELRALAAIAHPNVVHLNEHGVEADASEPYLWYTMPLYQGSDLATVLKATGDLSLTRAHAIFTRIAGGVCEMHAHGLRHQDIKPENIYLASMAGLADQHPVLLDLGGAAREHANRPLVATLPFAAPEQTAALLECMLGDEPPALTCQVDVYALAATLLFSLIGSAFAGHDIAQNDSGVDASPLGLVELRAALSEVHLARALQPIPDGALGFVRGPVRERLNDTFARWLSLDPVARPSARSFVAELDVLLEWDAELARMRASRQLRSTLLSVAGGLSLAAAVGGLAGYQWHKRTMGEAHQATNAALRKANAASDELQRAGTNLDKIIGDPSLGAVDKARRITDLVRTLEADGERLGAANARLMREEKATLAQARLAAQQDKTALDKVQATLDQARADQAFAEAAAWKSEATRDQAVSDRELAEAARARAEHERAKSQQEKAAAESARARLEDERDRLQRELSAAQAAVLKAESERAEPAKPAAPAPAAEP